MNFTIKPRILVFEKLRQEEPFLKQTQLAPARDTSISHIIPPKIPVHLHKTKFSTFGLDVFVSGDGSKAEA